MPPHKGKVQRPTGYANQRQPNQLFFKEKLEEWDSSHEQENQDGNIGPGLVVGDY